MEPVKHIAIRWSLYVRSLALFGNRRRDTSSWYAGWAGAHFTARSWSAIAVGDRFLFTRQL
ncbi:hypothetical protein KCP76_19225 [Salmonella enterica subsp. enterica serovar Weltevreden]|nr:hypothetical protein KCP76_19225 [Salmonella enterica subsp. enterica serovar Weltevreden]